ncbi:MULTISPECIES: hypothetical protein [unclassified Sporosarcina]|uniref:hypothetical protein n=1 Tax=unclassified Sporosarcina TaxID=2647733 RepID=UPI0012DC70C4|nr:MULTISPECIES: hypothetical protein [unclassified Sporosarcina]
MKGKTVAIGLVIMLIIVVAAIILMVQATFRNNPVQKNHQSMDNQPYTETGTFGWQ